MFDRIDYDKPGWYAQLCESRRQQAKMWERFMASVREVEAIQKAEAEQRRAIDAAHASAF